MIASNADVLLFAEDPGGANVLAPLVTALNEMNIVTALCADPKVDEYLRDRHIDFMSLEGDAGINLDTVAPRLLVTGTSERPESSSLDFIDAAHRRGITTLAAIDMITNTDRRFRGRSEDPLTHIADYVAVPDDATAAAYLELGVPEARIVVCGHPHYDVVRARRAELERADRAYYRASLLPNAAEDQTVVVLLAEGIDRLNPAASQKSECYTLHGDGTSNDRTTIVLQEVLDGLKALKIRPYIVLRLHPGNGPEDYAPLHHRVDHISRSGDPLPLIWGADLVIGMTTMLLVEAHLLGRPTLSVVPRDIERNWLPTAADELTPVVTDRHDIIPAMHMLLSQAAAPNAKRPDGLPSGAIQNYVTLISGLLTNEERGWAC